MAPGRLFVGRLNRRVRVDELERIFSVYGKVTRCDVKFGMDMAYAFVDYDDRRDAEDALRGENGRDFMGDRIIVEWAKSPRREHGTGYRREDHRESNEKYDRRVDRRHRSRSYSRSYSRSRSRSRGRRS